VCVLSNGPLLSAVVDLSPLYVDVSLTNGDYALSHIGHEYRQLIGFVMVYNFRAIMCLRQLQLRILQTVIIAITAWFALCHGACKFEKYFYHVYSTHVDHIEIVPGGTACERLCLKNQDKCLAVKLIYSACEAKHTCHFIHELPANFSVDHLTPDRFGKFVMRRKCREWLKRLIIKIKLTHQILVTWIRNKYILKKFIHI
jgi:hypothetical protein